MKTLKLLIQLPAMVLAVALIGILAILNIPLADKNERFYYDE